MYLLAGIAGILLATSGVLVHDNATYIAGNIWLAASFIVAVLQNKKPS